MMKITGLSHLFKWENLHKWWLTKYIFAPLYIHIHDIIYLTYTHNKYTQYKHIYYVNKTFILDVINHLTALF